ncbi:response regulator transcription factor [Arthrobacter sp. CAN_A1]|uniref:response regulator transcription factor n=1 Tax=Arthrobacter sp. CAN_A1 TaxID=2787717 RepID=UPI001A29ECE8
MSTHSKLPRRANPGGVLPGQRRILLVEDEPVLRRVVRDYLLNEGFAVDTATDGVTALQLAQTSRPDLMILDRMLPGLDGMEVCRQIRSAPAYPSGRALPIIMLTALGTEDDRVHGLEAGADDYVTKPFSPRELVLRVHSVLRRIVPDPVAEETVVIAGFRLDPLARTVEHRGVELSLTVREYELLAWFLRHPQQVFTRDELIRSVWGWDFGDLSTVTVHVRRVREKIEEDPTRPRVLQTVWGVGYRFNAAGGVSQPGPAESGGIRDDR